MEPRILEGFLRTFRFFEAVKRNKIYFAHFGISSSGMRLYWRNLELKGKLK